MSEPRVILYDIETSHNLVAKFDLRDDYIPHTNIITERYMICAAWKELGAKRVQAVSVIDEPKRFAANHHDDFHVIKTLHKTLSEADVIVAHNGDKFDFRWLQGRMLFHKLPPLPPLKSVDTYKVARRQFALNSNRLDYIGKYLGLGGKTNTPAGLWLDVLKGDKKAVRTMVDYNKRDVELLERIYLRLLPYAGPVVNLQLYAQDNCCPHCGSKHYVACGYRYADTQVYRRFLCRNDKCRKWFRSRRAERARAATHRAL